MTEAEILEFNFSESIYCNLGHTKFRDLFKFNVVWLSKEVIYFKTINGGKYIDMEMYRKRL